LTLSLNVLPSTNAHLHFIFAHPGLLHFLFGVIIEQRFEAADWAFS